GDPLANGALLDVDLGTYPYVTSSSASCQANSPRSISP
ncbi:adenylosuccinate synthetase, partial [Betaproteobacteria bacterium PRO7]|nr:adenylosuccinate synthetase [Betaproteobacteria bacterium PRO7]